MQKVSSLFIGSPLSTLSTLKQNITWQSVEHLSKDGLEQISYEGKKFIGLFLQEKLIHLQALKEAEESVRKKIELYTSLSADKVPLYLLSIVLIP